jgi:hypothetical protein
MLLHWGQPIRHKNLAIMPRFGAISIDVSESDDGWLIAEYKPLSLHVIGGNRNNLLQEIDEQVLMLFEEYAMAEDIELSAAGRRLKQQLLKDWAQV